MCNQWNKCGTRRERNTDAPRGADRTPNYWTAGYSTSARDLRADGDAANCGLILGRESAEWDIN
ncbi:hypothetical protein OH687_03180 [Burkholderia anthina]|nr:hypothetical protein OH687_03180 [Burkholderia anthina]